MFLRMVAKFVQYVQLTWFIVVTNITAAMAYPVSFVTQIIGAFLNGLLYMVVWSIFFKQFPVINGWTMSDTLLMLGIIECAYASFDVACAGVWSIASLIVTGGLDYYLVMPRPVLWHICVSRSDITNVGTIALGIFLFTLSGPVTWGRVGLFILMTFLSGWILFNVLVIAQSLTFYVTNFERPAKLIGWMLLETTGYPQAIFTGLLKWVMMVVLPAYFVVGLPVQLVKQFNFCMFGVLGAYAVGTFAFAHCIFYRGLKRYGSGNLLNVKM